MRDLPPLVHSQVPATTGLGTPLWSTEWVAGTQGLESSSATSQAHQQHAGVEALSSCDSDQHSGMAGRHREETQPNPEEENGFIAGVFLHLEETALKNVASRRQSTAPTR